MSNEQDYDRDPCFARTCISPFQFTVSLTSVETKTSDSEPKPRPEFAGKLESFENTKYEFHYCCKRYRANVKDIKGNEAKIDKNKINCRTLDRQEKLELRKQIIANQYLHTKNQIFLNRILTLLRTQTYVPENPGVALSMIRLYQQFHKDSVQGIQNSQLVLLQLFQNGAVYEVGDTCNLNEQRIMANNQTISKFEIEAKQIKQEKVSSELTLKEVDHLKNITMLVRGLLEENWTLLNENKNLYHQNINVRRMAGELAESVSINKRIGKCITNLEENKEKFLILLRTSADLTLALTKNQKLAPKEELRKEVQDQRGAGFTISAMIQERSPSPIEHPAEQSNYPSPICSSKNSKYFYPSPVSSNRGSQSKRRSRFRTLEESRIEDDDDDSGFGTSFGRSSFQDSVASTSSNGLPLRTILTRTSRNNSMESPSINPYGTGLNSVGSNNSTYNDFGMDIDHDMMDGDFDADSHSPDTKSFVTNILNQTFQNDFQDIADEDPDSDQDQDYEMSEM